MNKITATDDGNGLRVEVKGELGFAIAATGEILKGIVQGCPNEVTGFTAVISTIVETAFDPDDRQRIATLLYREFGGDGKCMKF